MSIENKVYCKECVFYRRGNEPEIRSEFVYGIKELTTPTNTKIKMPSYSIRSALGESLISCQHLSCFTWQTVSSLIEIKTNKIRIAGQAQLNANNDCKYFKQRLISKVRHGISTLYKASRSYLVRRSRLRGLRSGERIDVGAGGAASS